MNLLETIFLKTIYWVLPFPNRLGQIATTAGDVTTENSARLFIYIIRRLAELEESRGQ